jgi:hypothetical protein
MNKNVSDIVNLLDTYKQQPVVGIQDLLHIISSANKDFIDKGYSSLHYVGDTPSTKKKTSRHSAAKKSTPKTAPNPQMLPVIYNPFIGGFPPVPVLPQNNYMPDPYIPLYSPYISVNKVIDNVEKPRNNVVNTIPKINVYIDADVKCLGDLISILDKYTYSPLEEYNIDLKSLSAIKEELCQLNSMIGMSELKTSILNQLLYFIQGLQIYNITTLGENGVPVNKEFSEFKHTVLCGPPGTGKTEIAKIIGKMYSKIGILSNNVFKKVTRSDLVAGYLGQTAIKTRDVISDCLGGVLFIDEAYSLAQSGDNVDSFSKECIDTLCEALSDHKNDLMVIIAGYEEELENTFFAVNQGMKSRFIWRFKIDDYKPSELRQILVKMVNDTDWKFSNDNVLTDQWFEKNKDDFKHYGRDMELLFTYTRIVHSRRVYGKPIEERKRLSLEDFTKGLELMQSNKKKKTRNTILDTIYI